MYRTSCRHACQCSALDWTKKKKTALLALLFTSVSYLTGVSNSKKKKKWRIRRGKKEPWFYPFFFSWKPKAAAVWIKKGRKGEKEKKARNLQLSLLSSLFVNLSFAFTDKNACVFDQTLTLAHYLPLFFFFFSPSLSRFWKRNVEKTRGNVTTRARVQQMKSESH